MENFAKTGRGAKFFSTDVPGLVTQLKKIADELEKNNARYQEFIDEVDKSVGTFEDFTDKEKAELAEAQDKFDTFFGQLVKNFNIDDGMEYDLVDLKAIVRHAWNANK
jgi:hypothetical protein